MRFFGIISTIIIVSSVFCVFGADVVYTLKCDETHMGIAGFKKSTMDPVTVTTRPITQKDCDALAICDPVFLGKPYARVTTNWDGYKIVANVLTVPRLEITLKNGTEIFDGHNSELYSQLGANVTDADGKGMTTMNCFMMLQK